MMQDGSLDSAGVIPSLSHIKAGEMNLGVRNPFYTLSLLSLYSLHSIPCV